MSRLGFVVGHLRGEDPSGFEIADQARHDRDMIWNPMKQRVGEDEVDAGSPFGGIASKKAHPWEPHARGCEHFLGTVDADEIGGWIAFDERLRRKASAATEVRDTAPGARRNPSQQIHGRTISLGVEAPVHGRVPGIHLSSRDCQYFPAVDIFATKLRRLDSIGAAQQ